MQFNENKLLMFVGILLLVMASASRAVVSESGKAETAASTNQSIIKPKLKSESCGTPIYPEESRRLGEEGRVLFNLYINNIGGVDDVKLVQSSGHVLLDEAAAKFLAQCKFAPATQNGMPIALWKTVAHTWQMADDQAQAAAINNTEQSRVAETGGASFLAGNNTESFSDFLSRACREFNTAITTGASPAELGLATLSNQDDICSCVQSSAQKDPILKLLFKPDADKHVDKMDLESFRLYLVGKSSSIIMRCAAQSIDANLKKVNPRKKAN